MPKPKTPNPRNKLRGTTPSSFRLGEQAIRDIDLVAESLTRPGGTPVSRAEAIRLIFAREADAIRKIPDAESA
jgi:hypothetical protein